MSECIFCSRVINNNASCHAHQKACVLNPNRVSPKRSKLAGVQKGTPSKVKGLKLGPRVHKPEFALDLILVENSTYPRHCLKRRILEESLISYVCKCCGTEPIWCGKPMPLILDHINGINNDNRLENLRFVCSNCDTQLDTYKSRNRTKPK